MSFFNQRSFNSLIRRTSAVVSGADTLDIDAIRDAVENCRIRGYITSENMVRLGRGMIAMPVTVAGRQFAIVIGTTVQQLHASLDTLVETLRRVLLNRLACDLPPDIGAGASRATDHPDAPSVRTFRRLLRRQGQASAAISRQGVIMNEQATREIFEHALATHEPVFGSFFGKAARLRHHVR